MHAFQVPVPPVLPAQARGPPEPSNRGQLLWLQPSRLLPHPLRPSPRPAGLHHVPRGRRGDALPRRHRLRTEGRGRHHQGNTLTQST